MRCCSEEGIRWTYSISTFAAIICLSWLCQKLVVPSQFDRPSTGRHGPLSWPPLEVNQWKTLTLTRWFVWSKDPRGVNNPPAGCAQSCIVKQPGRRKRKTKCTKALPQGPPVG